MGQQYRLEAINNSGQTGSICVFQSDANSNDSQVLALAWFAKKVIPLTKVYFTWTTDYEFVWAEIGFLVPGVIFEAGQTIAADLSKTNQITFTNQDGAFGFTDQTAGPGSGSLYIRTDGSVPPNLAAVGIGMSGAPTFAAPALPNQTVIFSPQPKYWITFGDYLAGEVLNVTATAEKAEIAYPSHVFDMTATYGRDLRWTISPTT